MRFHISSLVALAAFIAIGCIKSQVDTGVSIGADACEVLLYATDPAMAPICASAQEVEVIVEAVVVAIEKSGGAKRPPTRNELYQAALKLGVPTLKGAAKAPTKPLPVCKPVQGQVSP